MATNTDYLTCYVMTHNWDEFQDMDWNITAEALIDQPVSFRCSRCGTVRRELWNRNTGKVEQRSYIYPEGYSVSNLELEFGLTKREHFRIEYVNELYPMNNNSSNSSSNSSRRRTR